MIPEPILNLTDDERKLMDSDPEECFRRTVQRSALSLDQLPEDLPSRVTAAVRSIATGERLPAPGVEADPAQAVADLRRMRSLDAPPSHASGLETPQSAGTPNPHDSAQSMLSNHPQLAQMVSERLLTPAEALEAAHAMDHALGRYLTGTRYAAP